MNVSISERIINESAKMFAAEGVRAIRMDDIAVRLGISKRTIYEQFKDKDTLITLSLKRHFEKLEAMQFEKTSDAANVIEEFVMLIDGVIDNMMTNHALMEGVKKFYPKIYENIMREHNRSALERFKTKIQTGIEQGLFIPEINIDLAIWVFADSVGGVIFRADKFLPNNISSQEAFKYITTYFFRGISTEKGIKILDKYIRKN